MFKKLSDWFDARTGYRALVHEALEEPILGGPRWRYVFGSALTGTFLIQLGTGLLLMLSYSPSSTTAWGSVYYINQSLLGGWFLRGIHHFGSQAMVVLLALHLIQVVVAGAYRAPREVNWWFGMALMFVTLAFSLTGYLLPWDQKGYWATKVATNIMSGTPMVGQSLQQAVVGGAEYGNQTLTRFYGLHVGILPTLLVLCLAAHVALFRKHGVTAPRGAQGTGRFWPEQLFMDTVATAAVVGILALLVAASGGAHLDAPADPSSRDYPARPEWYFLWLFQMLKHFPGEREVIGTIVIPGALAAVLLAFPLFEKVLPRGLAHFLACSFVFAAVGAVGYLTYEAVHEDRRDRQFQEARAQADRAAQRARRLAHEEGVPPDGAAYLLLRDPLTHGHDVLVEKCLGCHTFGGREQVFPDENGNPTMEPQTASDLRDFGSYAWVRGLLADPKSATYFGKVPQCGGMARWKQSSKLTSQQLDDVAAFVASFAGIDPELSPEEWASLPSVTNHPGFEPFVKDCGRCHVVGESGLLTEGGEEDAPNLFAWGSPRWLARMIRRPGAPDLYGYLEKKHQMPSFADQMTGNDLTALIRYLKNDYLDAPAPAAAEPPRNSSRVSQR